MYPVSDRFLTRLAESHRVVWDIKLLRTDGQVVAIEHMGGSVSVDRSRPVHRTCTVTTTDISLIPRTPAEQVAAYGATLRIARGVEYGDGTTELAPLGVFRLEDVSGDPVHGPVTLTGSSLEAAVADDKFTGPFQASGTVVSAISETIRRSIPTADIASTIVDVPIGWRIWDTEADPWAGVQEIAAVAGAEVYANPDGGFVISQLADPLTTTPVWSVEAGEGGVYISGVRGMSSKGVYNGVLARGESTGADVAPCFYLATDSDPGSPTYWGGPFGRRPRFYSSSTLLDASACMAAAEMLLRSAKAPNAIGDFSSLPNPALETGDVIRVVHPDGTKELHQVAAFAVPLDVSGSFPISTISAKEDS
ncbi:DUF5047 domain-containing protein [Streptomyces sp. ISL-66]|uniref:DUF5047 domain-containing protein n=1 Tax=Streptomyces sp. ISL-66 TaxID=2819186 RepID=UPI001BE6ADD7|nr:DUF5047 domain-containing protein [Streptomyces sp. ISL-66]MBT2467863.1 DUF5047 domain-containing protein [Streptomyces sp. ISL-66]